MCSITQSCPTLCDPMDCSQPGCPFMGFSGKNTPGNLLNPGIKPASPALVGRFFTTEPLEKPYNGILLSHNMSEIMPFATLWMNLEITILNKLSPMEKDKYHMISLVCEI